MPLNTLVEGYFEGVGADADPSFMPAPFVTARVIASDGRSQLIDFLIDSGATMTVIHPNAAREIWGNDYKEWIFNESMSGVGGGVKCRHVELRVDFPTIHAGDRPPPSFVVTVKVAEPLESNKGFPSLLGRDLIGKFNFRLNYPLGVAHLVQVVESDF